MCGISFFCSTGGSLAEELGLSLNLTRHRGPDYSDVHEAKVGTFHVGLGHNRLSVLDVSSLGNQPMKSTSGVTIIFNGEIYNHLELRADLEKNGITFLGDSDTEVILKLYESLGKECFSMLKGMFVITILDPQLSKLLVARDVLGIKPVYLAKTDYGVVASSEIKGLKPFKGIDWSIDKLDVYEFFNNGFLYEPRTGYTNVQKLEPGNLFEFDLNNGLIAVEPYAELSSFDNSLSLDEKLCSSVNRQLHSDVPLGVFFSGGTDSSLMAVNVKDAPLLFARYGDDQSAAIDEEYSSKIADYLDKKLLVTDMSDESVDAKTLLKQVEFVAKNSEELISDYTFWSTFKLAKAAKEHGYTVMLSGMGGDEAFAGYPRHKIVRYHSFFRCISLGLKFVVYSKLFPKSFDKKVERLLSFACESVFPVAYSRLLGYFGKNELTALFSSSEPGLYAGFVERLEQIVKRYGGDITDKVKLAQHLDLSGFLAHNLSVSDKASMLASIELRVPLLDESLVAHGMRLSHSELVDSSSGKKPLKTLLRKVLPEKLVERPKTGFNPPLDVLITAIGFDELGVQLKKLDSYFDLTFIMRLLGDHFSGKRNNSYKLWQLLYFSFWLETSPDPSFGK